MTARASEPAAGGAGEGPAQTRKGSERLLVFVVALLGLLILAALGAVLFKIIDLASAPPAASEAPATSGSAQTGDRLALPEGATVKSVSLSGDRLAVHYEAAGQAGVAVVDLKTGAVVKRLTIGPSSP